MKDKILNKITESHITMRPRLHFVLRFAMLLILIGAATLVSIALFGFIVFSIRLNAHMALLHYGPHGFFLFMHVFPWPLLLVDVVLLVIIERMLGAFSFVYRRPVLLIMLLLALVAGVMGEAFERNVPWNNTLRHQAHHVRTDMCHCIVTKIEGTTVTAEDQNEASTTIYTIQVPPMNDDATTTGLHIGDEIFIFGNPEGGMLQASGLRVLIPRQTQVSF